MIRTLLACCCATVLSAAELVVRDLRLGLASQPTDFDFELTTSTTSASGSDRFDGGLAMEGGVRWSFAGPGHAFGLIAGADLVVAGQAYDAAPGLGLVAARGAAGLGWAITDRITATAEGLAGIGLSRLTLPATANAERFTADGNALLLEARLAATMMATRKIGVGLALGWLAAEHDLRGDDTDLTLSQSSWYVGLFVAWRLDDAPAALE